MGVREQIEALLQARAATPRKAHEPKYLYFPSGTVITKNSGGAGTPAVHQVVHRVLNPKRQGKKRP